MSRRLLRTLALVVAAALALALAACGGGDGDGSDEFASGEPVPGQKRGGSLRVLTTTDVDSIDPGQAYFQLTYMVTYATQRPLYSFKPQDLSPVPDTAAGPAEVSDDARTVTVRLKPGIRFSPPVSREVTSADVKYAIERAFLPSVANGYAGAYFGALRGVQAFQEGDAPGIAGLRTPDRRTLVFEFDEPIGATAVKALALPISAPVPKEYAQRFDRGERSRYGAFQVATGPYMIANDAQGRATGYQPGRRIVLVRNPNWKADTDFRPAYLDRIEFSIGGNPTVLGRQILNGRRLINGDTPSQPVVVQAARNRPSQMALTPLGNRYVALNTKLAPFDDPNVRKAVAAGMDRRQMQLTRGGRVVGDIATHFLAPDVPGFEEAGGAEGPGFDFLAKPEGDLELAREYLRRAGFADGRYEGPPITMIGTRDDPAGKTAEVVLEGLRKLGFDVRYRGVSQDAMLGLCGTPARKIHVCPNLGWLPDFNDGFAYLYPTFNGRAITPTNNTNVSQLDDPEINAAMDRAARIAEDEQRAKAWGDVDRRITETAAAVPWFWDRQPNIASEDVQGVIAKWNAAWDVSFTSLKG